MKIANEPTETAVINDGHPLEYSLKIRNITYVFSEKVADQLIWFRSFIGRYGEDIKHLQWFEQVKE